MCRGFAIHVRKHDQAPEREQIKDDGDASQARRRNRASHTTGLEKDSVALLGGGQSQWVEVPHQGKETAHRRRPRVDQAARTEPEGLQACSGEGNRPPRKRAGEMRLAAIADQLDTPCGTLDTDPEAAQNTTYSKSLDSTPLHKKMFGK